MSGRCEAHIELDFDPISCTLPAEHGGPHRDTGVGADILWVPIVHNAEHVGALIAGMHPVVTGEPAAELLGVPARIVHTISGRDADPRPEPSPRDALGQALWDAMRADDPADFMPSLMTDMGSCLRTADVVIASLPSMGYEIGPRRDA